MATVFPDSMNRLDKNDVPGSLATIEQYIGYITERVEFSMRNMTRTVGGAGTSSVELAMEVAELARVVAEMVGTLGQMQGDLTTIKTDTAQLKQDVETVKTTVQTQGDALTALEVRVEALETEAPEPS